MKELFSSRKLLKNSIGFGFYGQTEFSTTKFAQEIMDISYNDALVVVRVIREFVQKRFSLGFRMRDVLAKILKSKLAKNEN
jgi:hypothetical protein